MTDNRTTELREKLTERGVEYREDDASYTFATHWSDSLGRECVFVEEVYDGESKTVFVSEPSARNVTPEQAITATLGGEYKRGYEDGLHANTKAAFAAAKQAIAVTLDGKTGLNELLDEFEHDCFMLRVEASETRARDDVVRKSYERIRDEFAGSIAATLGSGTCCLHYGEDDDGYDGWYCDECGGWFQAVMRDGHLVEPNHCQECGRAVKR